MGLVEELAGLRSRVEALTRAVGRHDRVPEVRWGTVTVHNDTVTLVSFPGESGMVTITRASCGVWVGAPVLVQVQGQDRYIIGTAATPWQPLPLFNGWTNFGNGWQTARYRRGAGGQVYLQGLITHPNANETGVFAQVPTGFRPTGGTLMFSALGNVGTARIDVGADGMASVLTYSQGASAAYVSLSGITYQAEG